MKKMIAMLCAIATGFFAYGDPETDTPAFRFSGVNFEEAQGYHAEDLITNKTGDNGGWYWFLNDNADEESGTVKAVEVEEGVTNQYLAVETGTEPLYRTVANKTSAADMTFDTLPTVDIDTGIFFDADVKFTPSAEAPTLADGAKFAVWALENEPANEGDPMTTNLMVTAGQYTQSGIVPVTFTLATPENFDYTAWHRLTIRAIKEVTTSQENMLSGFVVFVDGVEGVKGVPLAATDVDYATKIGLTADALNNGSAKFFNAQQLFLSAATMDNANQQLKVVGLQGSGAVDNLKITDYENAPIFARDEIQVTVNFDPAAVSTFKMMIGDVEIPAEKIDKTTSGKWVATVDGMTIAVIVSDIVLSDETKMVTNYDEGGETITIGRTTIEDPSANVIETEAIGFVVDGVNYAASDFAGALEAAQGPGAGPLVMMAGMTINTDDCQDNIGCYISSDVTIDLNGKDIVFEANSSGTGFYVDSGVTLTVIDSSAGATRGSIKAGEGFEDFAVVSADGFFVLGEDGAGDAGATIDGKIEGSDITLYKGLINKLLNEEIPEEWLADNHSVEDDTEAHTGFWKVISLAPEFEVVVPEIEVDGVSFASITADGVAEETPAAGTKKARGSVVVVYALDDGYELAQDSAELTQEFTAADTAVTPTAQKIVYALTLTPGENATLTASAEGPYYYNNTITVTAAPKNTDYEFTEQTEGWTLDDGVQTKSITFTDNVTIEGPAAVAIDWAASIVIGGETQKFRTAAEALAAVQVAEQDPANFPITVNVIKETANFAAGSTIAITAAGWAITGNTVLATDIVAGKAVDVFGALTYSGTVAGKLFATTITIPDDGAIVLVAGGQIITTTKDLAITVDTDNGYELKATPEEEGDNIIYTAELKTLKVTFAAPGVTEGSWPVVKDVEYGTAWTAVELPTAPVWTGRTFAGWDNAPETVTADVTVTAKWTQDTFKVKVAPAAEGTTLTGLVIDGRIVSPAAGDYDVATKLTATYALLPDYKWSADGETGVREATAAAELTAPVAVSAKTGFAIIIAGDPATTNYYPTLAAAIAAAGTGEPALPSTVTLLENAEIPAFIAITKDVTVDLNGFTLARANDEAKGQTLFEISEGATLTVDGTVADSAANGRLATVGKQWQSDGVTKDNPGKLVVNGGTYTAGNNQTVIHVNGDCTNCEVTINDATIESTGDNGVQFNGKGVYAINSSSITGATAIYMKGGELTIDKDSTITATKETWTAPKSNRNGSDATGDAIVMDSNRAYNGAIELTIADGATVTSAAGVAVRETITDEDASTTVKIAVPTTLSIALTDSFAAKVAAGEAELPGYVAVVGATPYATLADAFAAVTDGGTVTLLANYTIPEAITVEKATTDGITLDLNEKTLTGSVDQALVISGATTKFTIANGEYVSNGDNALKAANGAEVTIAANVTITGSKSVQVHKTEATTLNVYGSIKTADGLIGYGGVINVYDGASIQIPGSENAGVYLYDASATLNVYGGEIESAVAIYDWLGTATINFQGGVISGRLQNCDVTVGLTDSCETLFSDAAVNPDADSWTKVADLCAEGYEPQLVGEGEYAAYYQIVEKEKFTVTFMVDDQQYGEVQNVYKGAKATKPETDPTKANYTFDGWVEDGATDAFDFDTAITKNITLNAKFTEYAKFTVTLDFDADKVENVTVNGDAYTVAVELYSNTTVTVAATAKTGYKDVTFAVNGAAAATSCSFTLEKNSMVVIAATKDEPAYPSYIDPTDTDLAGEYDKWKDAYGDDTEGTNEEAFLLNCDPKNVETAKEAFKFTEITVDAEGNVSFKVAGKTPTTNDKLDGYNGYLVIKGKADLTTGEWAPKEDGDKFFQATLTTVKPTAKQ